MPNQPWGLLRAAVTRVRPLTPHLAAITFGGPELAGFRSAGHDQRIKLFLPRPGQDEPTLPHGDDWYQAYLGMPDDVRPVMRTYTVAGLENGEVTLWTVLHGDTGPASAWAGRAAVGDRVGLLGPTGPDSGGVEYQPGPDVDGRLIAGDESALPAIAAIVGALPAGAPATVLVEVDTPADEIPLPTAGAVTLRWLHRRGGRPVLADAVLGTPLPGTVPYAWVAGETDCLRLVRKHLRGLLPRGSAYVGGYWKRGATEDDILEEDDE